MDIKYIPGTEKELLKQHEEAINQVIAQERERIAKQLKMTVLFNDKSMDDGGGDELREKIVAFIRHELTHYHQQP